MPPSSNFTSIASAAAVSSIVLAAIFLGGQQEPWFMSRDEREEAARLKAITKAAQRATSQPVVPGIWNSGNTCFMNALLQAMAASYSLSRYFESLDELLEGAILYSGTTSPVADAFSRRLCNAVHELRVRPPLATSEEPQGVLARIGSVMASSARSPVVLDLSQLEHKLRHISKTFARPHEQQDADELLTITLDVLEKESKQAWRTLAPSLKSAGLDLLLHEHDDTSHGASSNHSSSPGGSSWWGPQSGGSPLAAPRTLPARAPLKTPLEGTLLSLIQCEKCGRKSPLRSTPFTVLALPIPRGAQSLTECLQEFVKYEQVEGVECSRCAAVPGRAPKQTARKRLMVGRLPQVLCLRLQRNLFDPRLGNMYKDQSLVRLPLVLDAAEACFFTVLAREERAGNDQQGSTKSVVAESPWKSELTHGMDSGVATGTLLATLKGVPPVLPLTSTAPAAPSKSAHNEDSKILSTPTKSSQQHAQQPFSRRELTKVTSHMFEEKHTRYRLVSVIEHIGSAFGGHYVAYRLVEPVAGVGEAMAPFWVRCSDDQVVQVSERVVLENVQAFMCVYERVEVANDPVTSPHTSSL